MDIVTLQYPESFKNLKLPEMVIRIANKFHTKIPISFYNTLHDKSTKTKLEANESNKTQIIYSCASVDNNRR